MANRPSRKVTIEVDPAIERMLAEVPDSRIGGDKKIFTPQQDALILAGYERKNKRALAEYLGCAGETLRKRYRVLQEAKNAKGNAG